jgi:cytidylate kinase
MDNNTHKTPHQIIESQIGKWELASADGGAPGANAFRPVIAVSRLPGCNTVDIVARVGEALKLDVFNGKLVELVAQDAHLAQSVAESLDETELSAIDDWMGELLSEHHFSQDSFFARLSRLIVEIGKHGNSIIVGRGATLLLPPADSLRVLLTAPLESRVENVVRKYKVTPGEARERILHREADRRAYIDRYFHREMDDPLMYDLTLNVANLGCANTVDILCAAWRSKAAGCPKRCA